MKLLKRVFSFYVNSSIHVALAVLSLVMITEIEFELKISKTLYGFVFFGAITGYNFVKYAAVAGLHHRSLTDSLKTIQVFSILCFVILLFFSLRQSFETLCATAVFGMLTLLYAVPFLRKKNLRNFSGLKIFIVAIVWAGVTVIVPLIAAKEEYVAAHAITFLQRTFIVIALTIPFEIRDLPYDKPTLNTLPQRHGIFVTKILGGVLLGICFLMEYFRDVISIPYAVGLLFACILTAIAIFFSEKRQPRYFASFWVESIPIVWCGFLLLIRHLLP